MYILTYNRKEHGHNSGFMTDDLDKLLDILRQDPTLASQLNMTPEQQYYLAKEDIMIAMCMNNPCLEIGLLVMRRFWCRRAYDLIKLKMDDETAEQFRREVAKLKLFKGGFEDSKRFEIMIDTF